MAAQLSNSLWAANANWLYQDKQAGNLTYKDGNQFGWSSNFTFGTNAGQAQVVRGIQITIAPTASTSLNFGDGSLKDFEGNSLVFTKLNGFFISMPTSAVTTQAASILIGAAGTHPISDLFGGVTASKLRLRQTGNGGMCFTDDIAGWTISAGSADQLKIANEDAANTAVVNIAVLGRT